MSVMQIPTAVAPDPHLTMMPSVGASTSTGTRFRIVRPYARGGLGEVFVAQDQELHREVALKQIQVRHADEAESRVRFVLEAEITGGLEHPGIVPVYGLGTYADGRPYYAMRFIRGDSLKDAIERFHSAAGKRRSAVDRNLELRRLLRRFIDVCNAIDYAHSRGVLHRDLKPGNIMLGKYGETLVVDWGLAKSLDRPDLASGNGRIEAQAFDRQRLSRDADGLGRRHAAIHESRAGRRAARPARPDERCLQPWGDALLPADRQDGVPGLRSGTRAAESRAGRVPTAARRDQGYAAGAGGDLPEGDGPRSGRSLPDAAGVGRRHRALAGRRAGDCLSRAGGRAAGPLDAAESGLGAVDRGGGVRHRGCGRGRGRADRPLVARGSGGPGKRRSAASARPVGR